jgi:hypothetical protein
MLGLWLGYCHFGTVATIDCGHEQNENPEGIGTDSWDAPVIVAETFHARAVSVGKMPTGEVLPAKCHAFGVPLVQSLQDSLPSVIE